MQIGGSTPGRKETYAVYRYGLLKFRMLVINKIATSGLGLNCQPEPLSPITFISWISGFRPDRCERSKSYTARTKNGSTRKSRLRSTLRRNTVPDEKICSNCCRQASHFIRKDKSVLQIQHHNPGGNKGICSQLDK